MSILRFFFYISLLSLVLVSKSYSKVETDTLCQSGLLLSFINDLNMVDSYTTVFIDTALKNDDYAISLLVRYLDENKIPSKKDDIFVSESEFLNVDIKKLEKGIVLADSGVLDSIERKDYEVRSRIIPDGTPIDSFYLYEYNMNHTRTPYFPIEIIRPLFFKDYAVLGFYKGSSRTYLLYRRSGADWKRVSYLFDSY